MTKVRFYKRHIIVSSLLTSIGFNCALAGDVEILATEPDELKKQDKSVGYKNNHHIKIQSADADMVVVAWGNHGSFLKRDKKVLKLLKNIPVKCFKVTAKGQPSHPLYQSKTVQLINYEYKY